MFLLYLASEPLIGKLGNRLELYVLTNGLIVNLLVILLSLAAIWIPLWHLGATHLGWQIKSSLKTFFSWPPIWLSVIFALYYLSIFPDYTFIQITKISAIFLAGLPIGFILLIVNRWLTKEEKTNPQQSQTTESFHEISKNPEKLIAWLQNEEAITKPAQDIFDMSVQARNISRLLLQTPLKKIALVGEYGSGKSSILNMIVEYLKPENRSLLNNNIINDKEVPFDEKVDVITCKVDGWGFAQGSTAEHILECAINELGKHVDVSGLRIVPEQYIAAMGSASNIFLKLLAALATCWKSPLDILKRIDRVLIAIDSRLIIFLEDVDRNKTRLVFFNEIAALLDTLRKLKRVSFVLAIGQKYRPEEVLIKTAEHIENVPRLNHLDVINAMKSFKSYCIEHLPDAINLIPKNYDKDRLDLSRSTLLQAMAEKYFDLSNPVDAIVELISNPRVLKYALRKTLMDWEKLAGEIDFDDLLIVNVLKTVDERIFSFIDNNISRLCAIAIDDKKERVEELKKKLEPEFNIATDKGEYNVYAVSELLNALFPGFADKNKIDWLLRQDLIHYQHIANDNPTKYWERIKRGELYDNEVPDCDILNALKEWNEDFKSKAFKDMEMVEALSNDDRVFPKARQFKKLISRDCLQKAASKQFGITLNEYGYKASREVCPAVNQEFTLGPERFDEQWQQWLLDEIEKALPICMRYVTELYHFWYDPKRNPDGELRAKVVEAAKTIYENNPALLAKVLDPDFIWSVFIFIDNFMEKNKDTGGSFHIKQWSWLGQVLLEAANVNPQVIGIHIAAMLSAYSAKNREKGLEFNYEFEQQWLEQIFNGNNDAVMKLLLLEGVDIEKYDEQSKKVLYGAQDEAKKWLNQKNKQPKDNHVT